MMMRTPPIRLQRALRARFAADARGTAAIEFAMIIPVLILFYFAVVELSLALDVNRKVSTTASVIGDLVAQAKETDATEVEAIFDAANAIMQGVDVSEMELRVTSLAMDGDGNTEVTWSRGRHTAPNTCDAEIATPTGVLTENQSVIIAEVAYTYRPPIGHFLTGDIEMTDTFYLRPRTSVQVKFEPEQC